MIFSPNVDFYIFEHKKVKWMNIIPEHFKTLVNWNDHVQVNIYLILLVP